MAIFRTVFAQLTRAAPARLSAPVALVMALALGGLSFAAGTPVAAQEGYGIRPGDTLIEATSGNTGIALAMAAAVRGYRLILIMPSHMSDERKLAMSAYGAQLLEVSQEQGMVEMTRAHEMMREEARARTTHPEHRWED